MGNKIHQGRNVKRIREILGVKQEALALEMGDEWSQRRISLLEQKEEIDNDVLEEVAKGLKVPADAIRNFNEEAAINVVSNTFQESAFINSTGTFNINPIEKWIEALEENKKLYERLLQAEKEKVALFEKMLNR